MITFIQSGVKTQTEDGSQTKDLLNVLNAPIKLNLTKLRFYLLPLLNMSEYASK